MTLHKQIDNSFRQKAQELQEQGYCILKKHFAPALMDGCRVAFLPLFKDYLEMNGHLPNRGTNRHFLPMPFEPPCFNSKFFFDREILQILEVVMGDKIVADQWGCDVPLLGSAFQNVHADYQRPLFEEYPDLQLPPHMLLVSFGLVNISVENGAIEIAPCTHRIPRAKAFNAVENAEIKMVPISLDVGDVLIRHPWALHRGTPNTTDAPRLLLTIRYVRNWYFDRSRDVNQIPATVWKILSSEQKDRLRFPVDFG